MDDLKYEELFTEHERKVYRGIVDGIFDASIEVKGLNAYINRDQFAEGMHYTIGNMVNNAAILALTRPLKFLSELMLTIANNPEGVKDMLYTELPEIISDVEQYYKANFDNAHILERKMVNFIALGTENRLHGYPIIITHERKGNNNGDKN